MARRGRPRKKEITIESDETKNAIGIISFIIAALLILSYFVDSPGFDVIKQYLGKSTFFAFLFFLNLSLRMFKARYILTKPSSLFGQILLFISTAGFFHYFIEEDEALVFAKIGEGGGLLGYKIAQGYLIDIFAKEGAFIILLFLTIISVSLTFSISIGQMVEGISNIVSRIKGAFKGMDKKLKEEVEKRKKEKEENQDEKDKMIGDFRERKKREEASKEKEIKKEEDDTMEKDLGKSSKKGKKVVVEEEVLEGALVNRSLNYPNWKLPPTSLLSPPEKKKAGNNNVKKNADIIEQTLQSFGVRAKVVDVMVGPTVTQYALNIALGTKVSRISNLKTDLALALAAPTGAVRIEAPIPGTSYVGIEIPNEKKETVYIRELMESDEMKANHMALPVCVGKRIDGKSIVTNLQKMPHLLVAGATGSGKSVLTNSFIISLLMNRTPDEVRMIMVDPKQVELSDYNGVPHLLTPVITDMQKVLNSLKWAIVEMEKRYTIFRHSHVRNILMYNDKMGFAAMPFIIIIMDEMADLMLSSGAEVETAIVKLAQKARATGIHLVLATQRPSVDVITGLIKANIPGRVGMSVATQVDSRVILDQVGAETLLGQGDMLFKEPDKAKPFRVQGVWVSQKEVRRVVKFLKSQGKEVHYEDEVVERQASPGASKSELQSVKFSEDEYFADAVRIVCNAKKGSASLLQRKLSIGYNRAARLLDELQKYGIVGEPRGSKPRKVIISDPEEFLSKAEAAKKKSKQ